MKGLLSVFQKHGGECRGLLLILNVAEIRPIEADKLLRQIGEPQERADHPSYIPTLQVVVKQHVTVFDFEIRERHLKTGEHRY